MSISWTKPTIRDCIEATARVYGCTADELRSDTRRADVALARQTAYWVARTLVEASYPQIGRVFSRDHTTVFHGCQKTVARALFDADYVARLHQARAAAWYLVERRVAAVMARDTNRAQILSLGASMPHLS